MNRYYPGNTVRLTFTFKRPNATTGVMELYDPTTYKVYTYSPSAVKVDVTPSVVRKSLGVFQASLPFQDEGIWQYRATVVDGSTEISSTEGKFIIIKSDFVP